jgi:SAM-dependent methyltransferase
LISPAKTTPLALVLEDLDLRADRVRTVGDPPAPAHGGPRAVLAGVAPNERNAEAVGAELVAFATAEASPDGPLLALLEGDRDDRELARWRNALWPFAHVVALYRLAQGGIVRVKLSGAEKLRGGTGVHGVLLVAHRRSQVLAPEATIAKFDLNAAGWDGKPGSPGYAHFRWMRRFVGTFAFAEGMNREGIPRSVKRILEFGCGAGWVGIEAALAAPGAQLCAFDPSPEMVKIAEENARKSGIALFAARTGFGEDPPFPATGEAPFDLVISSGVISFASDAARWLDGLAGTVASAGRLVVGDVNRESRGMRRRREERPLLPIREMNAKTRDEVRAALEQRGFVLEAEAGYQLTHPVPELMHWSETRLGGALNPALLWLNRARAGASSRPNRFDSWVLRFRRP